MFQILFGLTRLTIRTSFISLFLLASAFPSFAVEGVKWHSLVEGLAKARSEGKPSIVDFYLGPGCPRCEFLDKEVYGDPAIAQKINKDFVPIRIDLKKTLTEDEERLGVMYDYKKDCLLLFLDPGGNIVMDTEGRRLCFIDKVEAEWFIRYLDLVKEKSKKQGHSNPKQGP